jgi:DNA anti-recombination protein RmuC
MNADHELTEAYKEWRRLAEAETEAIQTCNWSLLAACQKSLRNLQQHITKLTEASKAEWEKLGSGRSAKSKHLDATIRELIDLERRNHTLLNSIRENAQQQLEQLDRAGRNLKRIHRSYSGELPNAWNSFS